MKKDKIKSYVLFKKDLEDLSEKLSDLGPFRTMLVQKGNKVSKVPFYQEDIKHLPLDLKPTLKSYEDAGQTDSSELDLLKTFAVGVRFFVLIDCEKRKYFLFVWPQHILHDNFLDALEKNKSVLPDDLSSYTFKNYYNQLSFPSGQEDEKVFLFPGAMLFSGNRLISNTSKFAVKNLSDDITKASNGKLTLKSVIKLDEDDWKGMFSY